MAIPLILTRPDPQSHALWSAVQSSSPNKFTPVFSPLMRIDPTLADVDMEHAHTLLFTSQNAVRQFAAKNPIPEIPALCVGKATTALARSQGFAAEYGGENVAAMTRRLTTHRVKKTGHFLHLSGDHVTGDLVGALRGAGFCAKQTILYQQVALSLSKPAHSAITSQHCVIPFFSPRTAQIFAGQYPHDSAILPHLVALSENVAAELRNISHSALTVAPRPTTTSMTDVLAAL